jgi:hypothetical protein
MKENPVSDLQMIEAAHNARAYCELEVAITRSSTGHTFPLRLIRTRSDRSLKQMSKDVIPLFSSVLLRHIMVIYVRIDRPAGRRSDGSGLGHGNRSLELVHQNNKASDHHHEMDATPVPHATARDANSSHKRS